MRQAPLIACCLLGLTQIALPATVVAQGAVNNKVLAGVRSARITLDMPVDLDTAAIRTLVELRLRAVGLRVATGRDRDLGDAELVVSLFEVGVAGSTSVSRLVVADVKANQVVWMSPTEHAPATVATTWSYQWLTSSRPDALRSSIEDAVNRFLDDWLTVNRR